MRNLIFSGFSKLEALFFCLIPILISLSDLIFLYTILNLQSIFQNTDATVYELKYFNELKFSLSNFGVLLILFLSLSVFIKIVGNVLIQNLSHSRRSYFATLMLHNRARMSIASFKQVNKPKFIKEITSEIDVLIGTLVLPFFQLISSLTTCVMIFLFLAVTAMEQLLAVLVFLVLFFVPIIIFSYSKIKNWSDRRILHNNNRFQILSEIFDLFRDYKFFETMRIREADYNYSSRMIDKVLANIGLLSILPRIMMEAAFFILLILSIIYYGFMNMDASSVFSDGLLLVAAFLKAGPAAQSAFSASSQITFGAQGLRRLDEYNELIYNDDNIKSQDICLGRQGAKTSFKLRIKLGSKVLKIKTEFLSGAINVIVAPSGIGKSLFLKALNGEYKVTGSVATDDKESFLREEKIGVNSYYVPPEPSILSGSVYENVDLCRSLDSNEIAGHLDGVMLTSLGDDNKTWSPQHFSSGQLQKLALARACTSNCELLLLDEALSNIDVESRAPILRHLCSSLPNCTILLVTHDIEALTVDHERVKFDANFSA
jgi:ATP-binding cassette, subfamily B, bacterial